MPHPPLFPGPARSIRRAGTWLALALGLSATYSCSLLIENKTQQCQGDGDCKAIGGTTCDLTTHLCRGGATSTSAGSSGSTSSSTSSTSASSSSTSSSGMATCDVDGGIDAGGCYNCAATTEREFLDHCTGASCKPFDRSRLTHLTDAGTLPPLPADAGGGG